MPALLIYGVDGRDGECASRVAAQAGLSHLVAGPATDALERHARELRLPWRAFTPEDAGAHLDGVEVVLNCAGPLSHTAPPLARACLAAGCHYLDLSRLAPEFERLLSLDSEAREAGVMLLPGVGLEVVAGDCLAARVARRLGTTPARVAIAFPFGIGHRQVLLRRGLRRRNGVTLPEQPGARFRMVDFGRGPRRVHSDPWRGELVTVPLATGAPTVDAFTLPGATWGSQPVARRPEATQVWAEAVAPDGRASRAVLSGLESHLFGARAAVESCRRVLTGQVRPGFSTPAMVFGAGLLEALDGVSVRDLPEGSCYSWPTGLAPEECPVYAYNQIRLRCAPEDAFAWLTRAQLWPRWYPNAFRVHLPRGAMRLELGTRFSWTTFGVRVSSVVQEFIPGRRLAWTAVAAGARGYHCWTFEPLADGWRLVTEETQRGLLPSLLQVPLSWGLHQFHRLWLHRLEALTLRGDLRGSFALG